MLKSTSLLVPCYNATGYLQTLIKSARDQTSPFAEIICYDDGSTDNTVQVAESLGARVIRGEGSGLGPSIGRNRLAHESTCEWIHFHDADDTFDPRFVERVSQSIKPETDVVAVNCDWVDERTRKLIIPFHFRQDEMERDPVAYFITHPMGIHGVVYRRETFLRSGGFDEQKRCWEDSDLQVRLAAMGAKFQLVDEVLAYSLRHDRGLSRDQKYCWKCRTEFLEQYAQLT